MSLETNITALAQTIGNDVEILLKRVDPIQFGGDFLIDEANNIGEYNGWGPIGFVDNRNSQDLGNVGVANLNRLAGGVHFPFDVRLLRLHVWHRNNNANANPWGWFIAYQTKTPASNTVTTTWLLDEVEDRSGAGASTGLGVRDYDNTQNQETDIDLSSVAITIPAGSVIVLGVGKANSDVEADNNRYVQVQSGYLHVERIT